MRRGLLLSLASLLVFAWALPARGHDGADSTGHATALLPEGRWMSMWMSSATPVSENMERVGGDNSFTGSHLVIEGNRMYVGWYGQGMRLYDISDPASPSLLGSYNPGARADAVPDATTFITRSGTRHIAVLNGTRRASSRTAGPVTVEGTDISEFLDWTDPARPKLLWKFVGPADGEAHNGDISDLRKWWLPSGGTGDNGLRIYDMRPLVWDNPSAPARLFPPQVCRDSADVRCDPVTLWAKSPYRGDKPVGPAFTHTHDITLYENYPVRIKGKSSKRDIILLAEGGDYTTENGGAGGTVFVIDITKPSDPVVLLRWIHENGPGHETIRYGHEAQFLDGDRSVMLVTDEDLHEGTGCVEPAGGAYAVRLSADLRSATELSEWFIPTGTPAAVCSVHVFSSLGNTVFFGSYNAGVQVVDYSDPANPRRVGQYIAEGATTWVAQYHKGWIYAGDMSRGLDVFRFTG
ncbi:MAG TPA: hypothetical protein VHI54_09095 [Actinomycetota bacterium]|nr:hypothetical protein [Actinomycetota bacterium]